MSNCPEKELAAEFTKRIMDDLNELLPASLRGVAATRVNLRMAEFVDMAANAAERTVTEVRTAAARASARLLDEVAGDCEDKCDNCECDCADECLEECPEIMGALESALSSIFGPAPTAKPKKFKESAAPAGYTCIRVNLGSGKPKATAKAKSGGKVDKPVVEPPKETVPKGTATKKVAPKKSGTPKDGRAVVMGREDFEWLMSLAKQAWAAKRKKNSASTEKSAGK